ncbi:MAG TPA: flavodoxin-dependent (E)-4-hydroxy-3-methylbut-2-enyl-diphosphate synthase [bacterium]|nr:flavodoxin-dependent (E)-4-hydroxy-3-methylbut-2-enyl-diphosphate synthase [bacterium]
MKRRMSREIRLGQSLIGGGRMPVIQTMITTPLADTGTALAEANRALDMGCRIVRTAVRSEADLPALGQLTKDFKGDLIADIHFDHRLALAAIAAGVAGVRFNPGNIGGKERVKLIVEAARTRPDLALRIGVNAGSLEKDILEKHGGPTADALVESTRRWVEYLEHDLKYHNFKLSVKSHSVPETVAACQTLAAFTDAPFHVGITEAGGGFGGRIKSAAGIAILFYEGLADTFRVSLTGPVEDEIVTGMHILKACGLLDAGGEIVSCPTCGRTHGTLFRYYDKLEKFFDESRWWLRPRLTVALMGCEVNGPGEAKEADLGVALGNGSALYFEKGQLVQKFTDQDAAFNHLLSRIRSVWGM